MKRETLFCIIMAVAMVCPVFPAHSKMQETATQSGAQDTPASPKTGERPGDNLQGATAPDFRLKVLNGGGKTMKLSALKGRVVLVNFWATWCEPCKIEMPWLVDLQKKYSLKGFKIVGVALDDSPRQAISRFARKMGVNYPILLGTEKVADSYGGVQGLPESFFIDRSGRITDHEIGLVSASAFESKIKKLLAQKEANSN